MVKYENGEYVEMTAAECAEAEAGYQSSLRKLGYEELVERLIRRKYSVSDELGIQRQRTEKPTEFAMYFAYCEECKQEAKLIGGRDG